MRNSRSSNSGTRHPFNSRPNAIIFLIHLNPHSTDLIEFYPGYNHCQNHHLKTELKADINPCLEVTSQSVCKLAQLLKRFRMNRRDYKKKVSDFFSFKSPKTRKSKGDNSLNTSQQKLTTDDEQDHHTNVLTNDGEESSMASASTTSQTTIASTSDSANKSTPTTRLKVVAEDMASKKRDVIIIGAGLSGECFNNYQKL